MSEYEIKDEKEIIYWLNWVHNLTLKIPPSTQEEHEMNERIENAKSVFNEPTPLEQRKYYIIKAEDKEQLFVRLDWTDSQKIIALSFMRVYKTNPETDKKEKAYKSLAKLFLSIYKECKNKNKLYITAKLLKPNSKISEYVLRKLSSPEILPKGYKFKQNEKPPDTFTFQIL